jgi:hypothetical protein
MKKRTHEVDRGKEMQAGDCYHGYLVQQLCGLCKPARWGRPTLWSAFSYFLLSRWVRTCWAPFERIHVDGSWQSIQSYEEFFLLSTTSTSCNAEIAICHGKMFPHQISSISIIIPLLVKSTYFIRIPFLYLSQKLSKTETVNFCQNNTGLVNH